MTKNKVLKKILYVDDELDLHLIVTLALETLGGFEIQCCSSGEEALIEIPKYQPDLILLDVMMPELSGIETLAKLRTLPKIGDTPVIFITARAQDSEVEKYKKLDILDVIIKPFDPINLASDIQKIWSEYE